MPSCNLINGLTVFNGTPYSAINTAKVLGIQSNRSLRPDEYGKFLTISNDGEKFAFQVDELVDVDIVELIKERPSSPSNYKKCKEDIFYCQPVTAFIEEERVIINVIYMKDIVKKLIIENALEDKCEYVLK